MLAIKLKRIGRIHQPSYRIVVAEKRSKADGGYVEDVGWFNPLLGKREFNKERIQYWLGVGAQPTDTVFNMLVGEQIISGPKRAKHASAPKAAVEQAPQGPAAKASAADAGQAASGEAS